MKKQQGFIDITMAQIWTAMIICGLIGYAIIRTLEWLWPYVKAVIHGVTA